jgi:CopG family transcriptional regulator/antitoxin EndoAI
MAQAKRIMVSLPESLLEEVDRIVGLETGNRSAFIREAMLLLLRERRLRQRLKECQSGYQKLGKLNRELAEDGIGEDSRDLEGYEKHLTKREY